ncbi:MAG: hypothetical protein HY597_07255 [Candidatus Omnitrophica bacterium]|nr:hypothetical protein [Candidatus Omnitrophota bacterium]
MRRIAAVGLSGVLMVGCATTTPYVGQGPHRQVTRGAAIPPIDFVGNVLALPFKLILWDWRFANHSISAQTEAVLVQYLDARTLPAFEDTAYRLNQYAPGADVGALIHNRHIAWPYRLLLGLPTTLIFDVLLPGRLFPWGDYYNPFTNAVHLYSDEPPIALHEAGHAYDYAKKRYKGTYAVVRLIPFVDLYQEWQATGEAVHYLVEIHDRETELHAYKILWPAYGTYVGSYIFAPIGTIGGALLGHVAGRAKSAGRRRYYEELDAGRTSPASATPEAAPLSATLRSGQAGAQP